MVNPAAEGEVCNPGRESWTIFLQFGVEWLLIPQMPRPGTSGRHEEPVFGRHVRSGSSKTETPAF